MKQMLKDRYIIIMSCVLGVIFTLGAGLCTKVYSATMTKSISNEVIRLHVLANSDTDIDQNLKQQVKDGVLAAFEEDLSASQNINVTRAFLASHLSEIEAEAQRLVNENGFDYSVSASLTRDYFPTKEYGDVVLPPGEYEALRIEIGQAEGKNWWCVMFPPLCYVDLTKSELPQDAKDELKQVLGDEEYKLVTSVKGHDPTVKVKFKIVEWWQQRQKNKDAEVLTVAQNRR